MTFETIRHLLEEVEAFHRRAGDFYRHLNERSNQVRQKLLFDYLSDEEYKNAKIMHKYLHDNVEAKEELLNTRYQFEIDKGLGYDFKLPSAAEDLSLKQISEIITGIDAATLMLYSQLATSSVLPDEPRQIFETLAKTQEQQRNNHTLDALLTNDI